MALAKEPDQTPSASRPSNELGRRPSSEAGEDVDRIASQARQAIVESRRLLDAQSSRSGFGSVAGDHSDRSDRTLQSSSRPGASSAHGTVSEELQRERQRQRRRQQDREAEQAALELEKSFDEAMRKQRLATRQAEGLLSECQAELERRTESSTASRSAEVREEAAQLRQAAKRAEDSARQHASEQRELRQRLQQLIDEAKAEVATVAQKRAEDSKHRQMSLRKQQKQLQKAKGVCADLSQRIQQKKQICEDTDRQIHSIGASVASLRRTAVEVSALAQALRSRLDGEETETQTAEAETLTLESGEGQGSLCDTGGSDTGVQKLELAKTALSAKVAAAWDRCRSLEQEALSSARKAEELSALVEHYQLQLSQPSLADTDSVLQELRAANEEHAELKKVHRQALAQLDGQHLQKLVTTLATSRSSKAENAQPTSATGLSETAQKVVRCEVEHVRELCLVETRIAEQELSQYEAFIARPARAAEVQSSPSSTLQEVQGRAKLRAAGLSKGSCHRLSTRLEHFLRDGEAKDLDLSGGIAPVLVEYLKNSIHKSIDKAKPELEIWTSKLTQLGKNPSLPEGAACLGETRAACQNQAQLCMELRLSIEPLEKEAAARGHQRSEELQRGAALRTRLEEALRAEAAMGAELCSKLEEECREVKVSVQGLELSSSHEAQACSRLREELHCKEEAFDQLAAHAAGLERADAELEERRKQLRRRMAAVSKALDFKAAQAEETREEAEACCAARSKAAVATEAERTVLCAALANLEAEKASLCQEQLLHGSVSTRPSD
ncbi:clpC [Symbiodinium necroappetens]|uniref:ClpC protein n=1 Tax=Symbiodinium necroappetens TaxID=1628268 RepID=A0A812PNE5_9DINO|nr:clpC [Symbiodinium necroappetens]